MERLKVLLRKENSVFHGQRSSVTATLVKNRKLGMTCSVIHSPCPGYLFIFFKLLHLPPLFHEFLACGQYHLEITAAAEFHLEKVTTHIYDYDIEPTKYKSKRAY